MNSVTDRYIKTLGSLYWHPSTSCRHYFTWLFMQPMDHFNDGQPVATEKTTQ